MLVVQKHCVSGDNNFEASIDFSSLINSTNFLSLSNINTRWSTCFKKLSSSLSLAIQQYVDILLLHYITNGYYKTNLLTYNHYNQYLFQSNLSNSDIYPVKHIPRGNRMLGYQRKPLKIYKVIFWGIFTLQSDPATFCFSFVVNSC